MRETWTFHTAGQLLFGRHAIRQITDVVGRLAVKRILLATDQVLLRAGVVDQVRAPLLEGRVTVDLFTGGEPEPSFRAAEACISQARQFQPDAILGLGG